MHLKDTGRAAALGNIFVGLTDNIKESSRGSCGKCSHPGLKKATVEGKRIPPDDGQVDERIGQQLEGEDRRADSDDEEPELGHHPAVEHIAPPTYIAMSSTARIFAAITLAIPMGETHMIANTILMIT